MLFFFPLKNLSQSKLIWKLDGVHTQQHVTSGQQQVGGFKHAAVPVYIQVYVCLRIYRRCAVKLQIFLNLIRKAPLGEARLCVLTLINHEHPRWITPRTMLVFTRLDIRGEKQHSCLWVLIPCMLSSQGNLMQTGHCLCFNPTFYCTSFPNHKWLSDCLIIVIAFFFFYLKWTPRNATRSCVKTGGL